jgi:sulfite exporter TauE/SafE
VIALLAAVLVASLAGSLHCAGMCGGLVVFATAGDDGRGARRLLGHAAYSGGRLVSYSALGAAAGGVGAALDLAGAMAGVHRGAALVAGATMIAWGVGSLLALRGVRVLPAACGLPLVRRAFAAAAGRPAAARALLVGLLTGLMPCGWLWAFLVTAAGTGSPGAGAAVMGAFWLGTVPVLLAAGLGAQLLASPLRRRLPAVTAVVLVVLGLAAIAGRPTAVAASPARAAAAGGAHEVPSPGQAPCCPEEGR